MLNTFFVKLKYVPLQLLSDRRLRILRFFWFAVHETVHGFFCLMLHGSYSIHDDDPRRHLCLMRQKTRAFYHREQNGRSNYCYNNVLYFFRCVFHEIIFLMIIFYCVTQRSRPAGSVATWFSRNTLPAVSCHCSTPHPLTPITKPKFNRDPRCAMVHTV